MVGPGPRLARRLAARTALRPPLEILSEEAVYLVALSGAIVRPESEVQDMHTEPL